jgi:hypothetical protein
MFSCAGGDSDTQGALFAEDSLSFCWCPTFRFLENSAILLTGRMMGDLTGLAKLKNVIHIYIHFEEICIA